MASTMNDQPLSRIGFLKSSLNLFTSSRGSLGVLVFLCTISMSRCCGGRAVVLKEVLLLVTAVEGAVASDVAVHVSRSQAYKC